MEYKDYYATLGLDRSASEEDIKRSYRKLARKYHPDVSKEPQAEERFKEVQEAYEVLKDAKKRAAYNQLGSNWKSGQEFRPPPGWQASGGFEDIFGGAGGGMGGEDFSDFFASLFGQQAGGGFRRQSRGQPHGRAHHQSFAGGFQEPQSHDQRAKIGISLEEAYHGGAKNIQLQVPEQDVYGQIHYTLRTLKVNIPKGITTGKQLRLSGQGGAGGDLLLEVEIQPHNLFKLEGSDIYLTLPITPWEAALGTKVSVPTLGGKVELKLAPNSQGGQKLRLKARGLPAKPNPGDQYVVLQIQTPAATKEEQRDIYEKMAKEFHSFSPRKDLN